MIFTAYADCAMFNWSNQHFKLSSVFDSALHDRDESETNDEWTRFDWRKVHWTSFSHHKFTKQIEIFLIEKKSFYLDTIAWVYRVDAIWMEFKLFRWFMDKYTKCQNTEFQTVVSPGDKFLNNSLCTVWARLRAKAINSRGKLYSHISRFTNSAPKLLVKYLFGTHSTILVAVRRNTIFCVCRKIVCAQNSYLGTICVSSRCQFQTTLGHTI